MRNEVKCKNCGPDCTIIIIVMIIVVLVVGAIFVWQQLYNCESQTESTVAEDSVNAE